MSSASRLNFQKHEIHVRMNECFVTKKERSEFLKKETGKYHVSELTEGEIERVLQSLRRKKIKKHRVVSDRAWAQIEKLSTVDK